MMVGASPMIGMTDSTRAGKRCRGVPLGVGVVEEGASGVRLGGLTVLFLSFTELDVQLRKLQSILSS